MGNDFPCPGLNIYKITNKSLEPLSALPLQDIFTVTDSVLYPGLLTVSEQISVWWILTSVEIDWATFRSPLCYKMNSWTTKLPCHLVNLNGEYRDPYLASAERSFQSLPLDFSNNLTFVSGFTWSEMAAHIFYSVFSFPH